MTTSLSLSGSLRPLLHSFSVYSCHLVFICSVSVRSKLFVLHCAHLRMKCSLGISNFLEEISSVFHSVVFLYFFELFTKEDFLSVLPILWNSAFGWVYLCLSPLTFTSLFSAICKASSHNHFALLLFFFLGMVLVTASLQCYKPPSIVLQALYLSDLIPWIYLSLPVYNHKGFDLGHIWTA